MVKTGQQKMTLEGLAALIQGTMASKEDLRGLRTEVAGVKTEVASIKTEVAGVKTEVAGVKDIQRDMLEELNATHSDVRYIRSTVDKLVHNDIAQDAAIQNLTARVHRLEQKVGLAKER